MVVTDKTRQTLTGCKPFDVAQVSNLSYRRLPVGNPYILFAIVQTPCRFLLITGYSSGFTDY
jgi:hypothetical protein